MSDTINETTTTTTTTNPMDLLKTLKPAELLAMVAEMQKAEAEAKAAAIAEEAAQFQYSLNDINESLFDLSPTLTKGGRSLAFEFVPATTTMKDGQPVAIHAHYRIVELKAAAQAQARRTRTGLASRTESVNIGVRVPVTVDGVEYRSYREAWDSLGYEWNGSHPSFNARMELIRLGHEVGPARR